MALPYPEGEVLFKRSVLKHSSGFDAENMESFYAHALVETVWNDWVRSGRNPGSSDIHHPRTPFKVVDSEQWGTNYGIWYSQKFTFSNDAKGQDHATLRGVSVANNQNANEIRDYEAGGPRKVVLMPVQLGSEKYMFMDMTAEVRAIYFPLAHQCDEAFPNICSYLMIDFRLRDKISFRVRSQSRVIDAKCNINTGLGKDMWSWTMGFDLEGVYGYLSLPHQLRNPEMGLYNALEEGDEIIWLVGYSDIANYDSANEVRVKFDREMDLAKVVSANLGVELVWAPYEFTNWALEIFKSLVEFGLGFIPVVGPLLAAEFSITITAITDPDFFRSDNILDLPLALLEVIIDSAKRSKKYLTPGMHFVPGSSEARSAARSADGGKARERRVKALREQAEQLGWGPAGWFAARVESLKIGEDGASAKSLGAKDRSISQSALKDVQSSIGSTLVKTEILCQNLQMKEHTIKFH
jgi:hypothetical protein